MIGIIPAAGVGKRLGINMPKALIPIHGKELIKYQLDIMRNLLIKECIVVERNSGISNALGHDYGSLKLAYVEQDEPRGIAHAVGLARPLISNDEPIFIILGDEYIVGEDFTRMSLKQTFAKGVIAYKVTNPADVKKAYSLEMGGARVMSVVEKPTYPTTNICGIGFYMFDPILFDYIAETPVSALRNEVELTDAINLMCKNHVVLGYKIEGRHININTQDDLKTVSGW